MNQEPDVRHVIAAVARSAATTFRLLATGRVATPSTHVSSRLRFADGTTSVVFRETALRGGPTRDPATLLVRFRLRLIGRQRAAHALFQRGCIVNTPLFAGFPGFVSKLWAYDPATGVYRGVYEWDGALRAASYASALIRVLALVSERGSIGFHVVPGVRRDDALRDPELLGPAAAEDGWWRLAAPVEPASQPAAR